MRYALVAMTFLCVACQQRNNESTDQAAVQADAQATLEAAVLAQNRLDQEAAAAEAARVAAFTAMVDAATTADATPFPVPTSPPLTFYGDPCTIDCSGHEAGYAWAEDKEIEDPDDCDGNSQSFIEGCESYAEERQEEAEETRAREEAEEEARAQEEAEPARDNDYDY